MFHYDRQFKWMEQSVVGRWCPSKFGRTGTQLYDLSGYNNTGTLTNMDAASDWVVSGGKLALDFDGSNDEVRVNGNSAFSVQNPSVSMWVYMRAQTGQLKGILDNDHSSILQGWVIQSEDAATNQRFYFAWYTGSGFQGTGPSNTVTIPLEKWSHVCYAKNGAVISGYLDGQLIYSTTTANGNIFYASPSRQVCIGAVAGSGGRQWNGQLDDICIYNRTLTPNEIQQLYSAGPGAGLTTRRRRTYFAPPAGGWKPYWLRPSSKIIGAGI